MVGRMGEAPDRWVSGGFGEVLRFAEQGVHPGAEAGEAGVAGLAAEVADEDLLQDHGELESGEGAIPAEFGEVEAGLGSVERGGLGPGGEARPPGGHGGGGAE